jgi:hypothetical protein
MVCNLFKILVVKVTETRRVAGRTLDDNDREAHHVGRIGRAGDNASCILVKRGASHNAGYHQETDFHLVLMVVSR